MPPSNKRPQRARREVINNNDAPDSSPSRPAKRRKKVEEPVEKPAPEPVMLARDQSDIELDDEELVAAVVPYLALPDRLVQASRDHANSLHEQHSKDGVQAYAKLAGKDWTFYVKRLKNVIGRPPEGSTAQQDSQATPRTNVNPVADDDSAVHVDLGPNKMVSRSHATIIFDNDSERWYIVVNGRNGIRIDTAHHRRGDMHELVSGEVIDIAGVEMMFVLPGDGRLKIHKKYLRKASLIQEDGNETNDTLPGASTSSAPASSSSKALSRGQNGASGPLPIAPAPPDYRRPGTPVSARTKAPYSTKKATHSNSGTMLMNADEVDLALDANKHIKPSYSYAQMISQAILDAAEEKLTLNGIYTFIQDRYAYYRHQHGGGWQNSIRHNLSLNKAFHKVARTTDEPGKGMKWCIVPEVREEMIKNCNKGGRGGHRGSSAPGSPGSAGFLNRGLSKDMLGDLGSALKGSPRSGSPSLSSYPVSGSQFTPDRPGYLSTSHGAHVPGDGSPLPRNRRPHSTAFGFSDNVPGSPVISSSYLQEDSNSFVTPAPHRVHPKLAPPSTAQRPSQHMPTSSPAPFWKFAEIGSTPLRGSGFESSPIKGSNAASAIPPSSSPAPARIASPTRNATPVKRETAPVEDLDDEEGQSFDLTKGFQSISSFHAPISHDIPSLTSGRA